MADKVFLDTNIFVYLANEDSPYANIIATMIANSIQNLFTLNTEDFKKFKKIKLITI